MGGLWHCAETKHHTTQSWDKEQTLLGSVASRVHDSLWPYMLSQRPPQGFGLHSCHSSWAWWPVPNLCLCLPTVPTTSFLPFSETSATAQIFTCIPDWTSRTQSGLRPALMRLKTYKGRNKQMSLCHSSTPLHNAHHSLPFWALPRASHMQRGPIMSL